MLNPQEISGALKVAAALTAAGGKPLFVGGCVRDHVMGRKPKDIDIEVYELDVSNVENSLQRFGAKRAGAAFGVFTMNVEGLEIEVSIPRRESKKGTGHTGFMVTADPFMSIYEASLRRDLRMNAMAMDPFEYAIYDYHGGIQDIINKKLSATSILFKDDPLRPLRVMRFASALDMEADEELIEFSALLKDEYWTLSKERVWTEWYKWSLGKKPSRGLKFLQDCGWIGLYPEIEMTQRTPQDQRHHPEGVVFNHILLGVDKAAEIATREKLSDEDRSVLVFAALGHDFGKILTTTIENGKISAHGHEEFSCDMVLRFMRSIGADFGKEPNDFCLKIARLCRFHMRHLGVSDGGKRAVRRIARDIYPSSVEMLALLIEVDASSRNDGHHRLPIVDQMVSLAKELNVTQEPPKPILMGRHLIELGMKPCKEFGEILAAATEAHLDGAFSDLEGAKEWVRNYVKTFPK